MCKMRGSNVKDASGKIVARLILRIHELTKY